MLRLLDSVYVTIAAYVLGAVALVAAIVATVRESRTRRRLDRHEARDDARWRLLYLLRLQRSATPPAPARENEPAAVHEAPRRVHANLTRRG